MMMAHHMHNHLQPSYGQAHNMLRASRLFGSTA
jgi:hypothetical protein